MRIQEWWKRTTLNEKLMYGLILILLIGIASRWRYVLGEVSEAFSNIFNR